MPSGILFYLHPNMTDSRDNSGYELALSFAGAWKYWQQQSVIPRNA
jgi:hypothetical protein